MRKQKVHPQKIREMKKPRRGWNDIPACMREEVGIRGRAFCSDRVGSHGPMGFGRPDTLADNRLLARHGRQASRSTKACFCNPAVKSGLLILIVSAYCSGLRCSRFNLN
jgi:hypothetical protein